ncbi:uncharacterized protein DUF2480 [Nonlabens dokdonensis]|jgi:hypothetical protein|uniref:DUF2480 domain containing protein n=2 Tax=Nonlabens dokdonensis TaxID=328515 RepID=L7WC34_NONDD|nr:DUF2480 family protein [Nonlabens dokdonensis]AGC76448.1 DUF2480 domain containing protein [Nonlabens dokdonensis DSW-6]PZX44105.1 uncharacterized protein DUF2480 [Nonlabens dokdonensis]
MAEEIINRVANSKLKTFDLEDFYVPGPRTSIDISKWLLEGIVLVESRFRESLKTTDFSIYKDHYVVINCSTDAIIPQWAWMLVQSQLHGIAKKVVVGTQEQLETELYREVISNLDVSEFKDIPMIVKGCSNKPVPVAAYAMITDKLQSVAKSIMYGEACSAVPVFKKKKQLS